MRVAAGKALQGREPARVSVANQFASDVSKMVSTAGDTAHVLQQWLISNHPEGYGKSDSHART